MEAIYLHVKMKAIELPLIGISMSSDPAPLELGSLVPLLNFLEYIFLFNP
jgi:hypothetical protein